MLAAGCGAAEPEMNSSVSDMLERSVGELRESLGRPWGRPVPGLAAAATVGPHGHRGVAVSGASDPPGARPLDVRDRFHIGSITKTFTAALILQLDQERRLSLDDPISTWFDFPGGDRITVRMLLGHTSGIADFTDDPGYRAKQEPADLIAIAARLPSVFAPGENWAYSNTNYTMLGVISEQVTGHSWGEEVEGRFLTPLGLTDTYIWRGRARPRTVDGSRVACGAAGEPDCNPARRDLPLVPIPDGPDWIIAWSAGGLVSTPTDVSRWMRALVVGNVLDPRHRALMTTATPQSIAALRSLPAFGNLRWTGAGLGLFRYDIEGRGIGWGHEGLIDGFTANTAHMIEADTTVAVASNFQMTDSFTALGELVAALPTG